MAPLIAREVQLQQLQSALKTASRGRLQIVFISGEPGIGKTTLVKNFIEQARQEVSELFIASSKCDTIAGGQQEPYLPFIQILQSVSQEKKGNRVWDRLRRGIVELGPDWLQILPGGDIVSALWRTVQWGQQEFVHQGEGADLTRRLVQYTNTSRRK